MGKIMIKLRLEEVKIVVVMKASSWVPVSQCNSLWEEAVQFELYSH